MKVKCPICGETIDLSFEQCKYCGTSKSKIRSALLRQREQLAKKENVTYTSKELDELFEFEENGTGVSIKEYFGLENVVFLPNKYKGKTVNAISPHAFEASDVEEVYFSDSIRVVMQYAFADCFKLKNVDLSVRLRTIENNVFSNCISLTSIFIPESVIEIGKYTFSGCVSLNKVKLSERLEIIEEGLFEGCKSLPYFILPLKVKSVETNAFQNCIGITKVKFNSGLLSIKYGAFNGCVSLERVLLSETVTALGEYAFQDCKKLKAFYIGKELSDFNGLTFYGCDNLCFFKANENNRVYEVIENGVVDKESKSLVLGGEQTRISDSLKSISSYAYSGLSFYGTVLIPKNIISIEANSFYNTSNFEIDVEHIIQPAKWNSNWILGENRVVWGT